MDGDLPGALTSGVRCGKPVLRLDELSIRQHRYGGQVMLPKFSYDIGIAREDGGQEFIDLRSPPP